MRYINTKGNNEHYLGKVWITKGDRLGKNICVDMGVEELRVIAFVPTVTKEIVEKSIKLWAGMLRSGFRRWN